MAAATLMLIEPFLLLPLRNFERTLSIVRRLPDTLDLAVDHFPVSVYPAECVIYGLSK